MLLPSHVYYFMTYEKINVKFQSHISLNRKLMIIYIKSIMVRRFPVWRCIFVLVGLFTTDTK